MTGPFADSPGGTTSFWAETFHCRTRSDKCFFDDERFAVEVKIVFSISYS